MRYTDIAIVGGGLAGSGAAAMLERAGVPAILIDPHRIYPPELRCEKLDRRQVELLRRTGLADAVLRAATHDGSIWIARFGHLLDKKPSDQHGIRYDALVNTVRAQIRCEANIVDAKALAISTGPDRQKVALSNGEEISARLVVLANGLNVGLRHTLGIERRIISACHSVTLGFDIAPAGRAKFEFAALTYYPERSCDRMAYLTLFPIDGTMRANLMVYRQVDDPWFRELRQAPEQALLALMPGLGRIAGRFKVTGQIRIRPADLYVSEGHRQDGLVLVGDAFATSCPAAGTGTNKVFTDVERLCHHHIPEWLSTDGMDADKIAAFYDDPIKTDCDAWSTAKAYHLRALSIDNRLSWRARRWARFIVRSGEGGLRQVRNGLAARPGLQQATEAS
ncbi:MAG TPA: FAD-dependent monooxygenase [Bradyrhizobium sp.]|nr:FAD-dependent monooxygenase [Bradyrhizobium sp.]